MYLPLLEASVQIHCTKSFINILLVILVHNHTPHHNLLPFQRFECREYSPFNWNRVCRPSLALHLYINTSGHASPPLSLSLSVPFSHNISLFPSSFFYSFFFCFLLPVLFLPFYSVPFSLSFYISLSVPQHSNMISSIKPTEP